MSSRASPWVCMKWLGNPQTHQIKNSSAPQNSHDFNISPTAQALPDLALAPSYASLPVAAPALIFFVATPLE